MGILEEIQVRSPIARTEGFGDTGGLSLGVDGGPNGQ